MKLYSCKLRLAGAVTNEILKAEITAAEIEVLREIHGADSVVDIKQTGENATNSMQERARLRRIYASEESLSAQSLGKRIAMLRNLFGHDRLPLPDEPLDPANVEEIDEETIDTAPAPVVRTRVTKKQAEAFAE